MNRPVLLLVVCASLLLVADAEAAQAEAMDCFACHGDPDLATDGVRMLDREAFERSVHGKLACETCHEPAEEDGFEVVPHRLAADGPPKCIDCHDEFGAIQEEMTRSVHVQRLGETFTCVRCHDPHDMVEGRDALPRGDRVPMANHACVRCHRDSVFRVVGRRDGHRPSTAHDWLPSLEKHARMRCVVCHTPIDGKDLHQILPKEQSVRDCSQCHDPNAPMIAAYVGKDERLSWVTNPLVFEQAYVPGAVRHRLVDTILVGLLGLMVLGALFHGIARILTQRTEPLHTVERIYLYHRTTRFWHWSNAVLIVLLAFSGLRMHFGGRAAPLVSFELAFNAHNLLGVALVFFGLFFVVSNFLNGNWKHYLTFPPHFWDGVVKQSRWYVFGFLKGEPHPFHPTEERKFNPLQQLTYLGLLYVFFPVLSLTGILLLFPQVLPDALGGRPGAWWVATAHYLFAMGSLFFLVGHLYLATMGDKVHYLLQGMITGWHKHHVPKTRTHDDPYPE